MSLLQVPLEQIKPNPWQTRGAPATQETIKELALDIMANGLLQTPIGRILAQDGSSRPETQWRLVEDGVGFVQLAFGHNRLAAYRWLNDLRDNSDIPGDYAKMPVQVLDLSDMQMANAAWSENQKRRDVTAIERARAVALRLEHFKWSNRECAEALGIDHSTVSNLLRLLKLPEELQAAILDGSLSERSASAVLPLFEAPESHGFGGYSYTSPESITQAALSGESSDRLRSSVERYFDSESIDLTQAEFKLEQLLPEGGAIYCGLCKTCDRRMPSRNRCFDHECFVAKIGFVHREYLKRASKASGFPLVDDKKGGYTTSLPWEKAERNRIIATQCPNLVLEYSAEKTESCIVDGFPHARLVCEKRNDSCSCIKGMRVVARDDRAGEDEHEWRKIGESREKKDTIVEDAEDAKVAKRQNAEDANGTKGRSEEEQPAVHPLSAGELEDVARQARKAKREALAQGPGIRAKLEEHLFHQAVMNRPGVFIAALNNYVCAQGGVSLDTMDEVYRLAARKVARLMMPADPVSPEEILKFVDQRLKVLHLDPLEGDASLAEEAIETIAEF